MAVARRRYALNVGRSSRMSAGRAVASAGHHDYEYPAGAGSHVRARGGEDQCGDAPGTGLADRDHGDGPADGEAVGDPPGDVVERRPARCWRRPRLVVVTGAPGSGRSTVLRPPAADFRGPVFAGGGLAMLPGRARARRCPGRCGSGCPPTTRRCSPRRSAPGSGRGLLRPRRPAVGRPGHGGRAAALAAHCRVLVALRTPHRLPADAGRRAARRRDRLAARCRRWTPAAAADLARRVAPGLGAAAVADGGPPRRRHPAGRHRAGPPRRRRAGRPAPPTPDGGHRPGGVRGRGRPGRPDPAGPYRDGRARPARPARAAPPCSAPAPPSWSPPAWSPAPATAAARSPRTWPRSPPACSTPPARQRAAPPARRAGAGPRGGPAPGRRR